MTYALACPQTFSLFFSKGCDSPAWPTKPVFLLALISNLAPGQPLILSVSSFLEHCQIYFSVHLNNGRFFSTVELRELNRFKLFTDWPNDGFLFTDLSPTSLNQSSSHSLPKPGEMLTGCNMCNHK